MTTYTAWDGNEYPMPTPDGWYLGTDDRWWPEGHGPGPAPMAPAPLAAMPAAAPPIDNTTDWTSAPEATIYSSPPAAVASEPMAFSTEPPEKGGNGKKFIALGAVLLGLVAVGVGAFVVLGADDSLTTSVDTTVFQTQQSDLDNAPGTTATTVAGDAAGDTLVAAPEGKGSLDDPYAVGETVVVQYADGATGEMRTWNLEVLAPASDLTQAVLDENQFNEAPEGDLAFVGAPIRVTYVSGPAPASLFELTFKAVGPSGVVLTTFDPSCGVIPDDLDTFADLFEGGTVEGNVCWGASPVDAGDLTLIIEVFLDDTQIYVDMGG